MPFKKEEDVNNKTKQQALNHFLHFYAHTIAYVRIRNIKVFAISQITSMELAVIPTHFLVNNLQISILSKYT